MQATTDQPIVPTALLTARQVAQALSISERKLWSLTASGHLPAIRLGRSVRYAPSDVAALVDRQRACLPTPSESSR